MAQNVTIAGAQYSDVPAVGLPLTAGGTAMFYDPDEISEVFTAVYGQTSYNDILAAYNAGKKVQCIRESGSGKWIYDIAYVSTGIIRFGSSTNTRFYSCSVEPPDDTWYYEVTDYSSAFVKTSQGTSHAGEFLVVGSDGNVTTKTMTAWQGGSY